MSWRNRDWCLGPNIQPFTLEKFARTIVQLIRRDTTSVFAITTQRQRSSFVRSELVTPAGRPEQEAKRRRLDGKQSSPPTLEQHQVLMKSIDNQPKRVGKQEISHGPTCQLIQEVFPDKKIVRILACRGTETGDEAPFRRTIMLHRVSQDIKYERHWEQWTSLSNRPAHPCRINITVFARDHVTNASSRDCFSTTDSRKPSRNACSHLLQDRDRPAPQPTETVFPSPIPVSPAEMPVAPPMQDSGRPAPDTTTGAKAPEPETAGDCPLTKPVEQTFRFHSSPKLMGTTADNPYA